MLCLLICHLANVKSISFHVKWTRSCYIVNFQHGVHIVHPIYAATGKSGACQEFCVLWACHMMIIHCYDHTTREYY